MRRPPVWVWIAGATAWIARVAGSARRPTVVSRVDSGAPPKEETTVTTCPGARARAASGWTFKAATSEPDLARVSSGASWATRSPALTEMAVTTAA